ncbi:MAG: LuxR family transcriptional regulator [Bacteroidetes bacterium]|jgi:ligand-binding sensor domain-containing protein/DNA-binding CsgD family transcriptional regulator|nr:LuxR family transcriptional regulator [Bacteroidota bacterium]
MLAPSRHWGTLLLLLGLNVIQAQELPPVLSYEPDVYQGGNQNWMIGQDERQFIYVANNKGLLEFNGMQWTRYPSPNETTIRAVRAVDGRVYTGCYMEFGYWERDATGKLQYHSLSAPVQQRMVADEHFWNIVVFEQYLIFQSLDQLFLYDLQSEEIDVIPSPHGIDKLFKTPAKLLVTGRQRQLYALERGGLKPLLAEPLTGYRIMQVWEDSAQLYVQTATEGRFVLDQGLGTLQPVGGASVLKGRSIYSALTLSDGRHAFGTISDGVFLLEPDGELVYHLTQSKNLTNNTVLSLFEDNAQNLWVGTDNGISCINLSAPIRKYTDRTGRLGTVYAAQVYSGKLYLGTNQGLFCRSLQGQEAFQFVPRTKGQVWSLYTYGGQLLCGHDSGTFLVDGKGVQLLYGSSGTWCVKPVPGRPGLLLQGNYDGLSVLERVNGRWRFRNKIKGFDYSARYVAMETETQLYISHEYRGVFGLQLGQGLREVSYYRTYEHPAKGKNAGLINYEGDIFYASRKGIFRLEGYEAGFKKDSMLSQVFDRDAYESGKMSQDRLGRLWLFAQNNIYYFNRGALRETFKRKTVPVPMELINAMSGYENITLLDAGLYLIGTADGYLLLDREELQANEHSLYLTEAISRNKEQETQRLPLKEGGIITYASNSLSFEFAVPVYSRYFAPHFQYRLKGFYESWSDWSSEAGLNFKNLPYGAYQLEVRSRVGDQQSGNTIRYPFTVLRPWYWSIVALVLYGLGTVGLIVLTHRFYTRYYRRQASNLRRENQRRLEAQQRDNELALVRMKNEQLQKDIESKNRELAISTMSLVKKNELLHRIKGQLQADDDARENIRAVIRTIDKNTDEEETWNFFKEAFENADQDFFKKIQQRHPKLTHNDLKLCAYLRLNLSSKEIAPLLNISVRSVEVKRYRLRKKMELEHDEGLVEHIIAI